MLHHVERALRRKLKETFNDSSHHHTYTVEPSSYWMYHLFQPIFSPRSHVCTVPMIGTGAGGPISTMFARCSHVSFLLDLGKLKKAPPSDQFTASCSQTNTYSARRERNPLATSLAKMKPSVEAAKSATILMKPFRSPLDFPTLTAKPCASAHDNGTGTAGQVSMGRQSKRAAILAFSVYSGVAREWRRFPFISASGLQPSSTGSMKMTQRKHLQQPAGGAVHRPWQSSSRLLAVFLRTLPSRQLQFILSSSSSSSSSSSP